MEIRSESRKAFDVKREAFEKWYQSYIKTHDVGDPKKYKTFAEAAFTAGAQFSKHNDQWRANSRP